MGASASISLCSGPAPVKVLKRCTRVEPEPPQTQDPNTRAVFGVSLQNLRDAGRLQHGVPLVLKNMVEFLEKNGLQQKGVFRVCGSAPRCTSLRGCLDRGERVDLEGVDVPTVAALLKQYLRELPSGLIPHTHSTRMQQALMDSKDGTELLETLKETLHRLPDDNYNILSYLLHFLSQVAAYSQWNHMTSENLATVFGPCIFHVPEGPRMLEEQTMCNTLTQHLLEKHTRLIPNTHTITQLRQEQAFTSEKVCDVTVGVVKETSALPPTTAETRPLSGRFVSKTDTMDTDERRRSVERGTDEEKKEKAGHTESHDQESCLIKKDQSYLICSNMSLAPEHIAPDSSRTNDDTHSDTHSDTSDKTQRKNRHALSKTRESRCQKDTRSNTSLTHSLRSDTQTESRSSHSEPGSTHAPISNIHTEDRISQSKHVPSEYICTHTQSPDTHAARLMEEEDRSASSLYIMAAQNDCLHRPISSQAQTPCSRQDSASCATSSQSPVRDDFANCSHEMSSSQLHHHIQKLKLAIRSFEESFKSIHNYKPALNDKMAHPEVAKLMTDLSKARKQLKERQRAHAPDKSETQELHSASPHKPAVEDTLNTLTQRLKEKRLELNVPERIQDMSHTQLALEKTTLQKCLLYYESLHGRPSSQEERSMMKVLYDRYHLVKQAFYGANTDTAGTRGSEEDANPAFITQMVTQATDCTNDAHVVNRVELLRQLKQTRIEKHNLKTLLREFEKNFLIKNGRNARREDRLVMAEEYHHYRALKDRLRLLKGLLGKKTQPQSSQRQSRRLTRASGISRPSR